MKLDIWMNQNKISDEEMASIMETTASAVQKWRLGARIPRVIHMMKFLNITNNEVTPNDFFSTYVEKNGISINKIDE